MNAVPVPEDSVSVAPATNEYAEVPKRTLHGVEIAQLAPIDSVVALVNVVARSRSWLLSVAPPPPPPAGVCGSQRLVDVFHTSVCPEPGANEETARPWIWVTVSVENAPETSPVSAPQLKLLPSVDSTLPLF